MSAAAASETNPAAPVEWRPRANPWLIAVSVMLATFMEVLDTSIASVALPYIAGNLGASNEEATWVLTSYLVSNAIVLPTSAWFASQFGQKRFLTVCIVIFITSSFLCGISGTLGMLIIARVLQGAGGGALQPLAQAILFQSFPPAKRGVAAAVYGVGVVCAPIIGPTLGGWLTYSYSWRWAFYINVPIGILAVFLISIFVEDPPYIRGQKRGGFDALGFGLLAIWLATLQILLDKGEEDDWFGALWLRWCAGISFVSMICFIIRELHTPFPVVDLRILKNRNFTIGCTLFLLFGGVLYALTTMQPLFLQSLLDYAALDAGLTVSPRGVGVIIALGIVGVLVQRVDTRRLIAFGFTVVAIGCFMFSRLTLQVAMRNIVPANLVVGFGMGFIFVPLTTMTMGALRNEQIGNGSGIQNLMRNIGGSIGISFVATMLDRYSLAQQNFLVANLTPLNPIFQDRVEQVQRLFESRYTTPDALERAQAFVYNIMLQQADYWAYMELFFVLVWISAVCVLGVALFRKVKSKEPVALH